MEMSVFCPDNYMEMSFCCAIDDFYLQLSMIAGDKMKDKDNTLIFIDEIQAYPQLLTLLKFLSQDNRFTYIASGSLLGVTLSETTSIPMGSIRKVRNRPLHAIPRCTGGLE